MKIRNRLYLASVLVLVVFIVTGFTIIQTNKQINIVNKKSKMMRTFSIKLGELNSVSYEYLLYHEERMQQQWQLAHNSISKLLKEGKESFNKFEEDLESISRALKDIRAIFLKLIAIHEKRQGLVNGEEGITPFVPLEARLISQLLVKSHHVSLATLGLEELMHQEILNVQRKADSVIIISLILFIVVLLSTAFFTNRSIATPISRLVKGAEIIGSGNLDYKVGTSAEDEVGHLSRAFDQMTENLKVITVSRERLNIDLAQKNKELEQIVYVTSHDLRSPLVNVQGFTKELDYSLKDLASAVNSEDVPADVKEKVAFILEEEIPEAMQYIHTSTSKMDSLLSGLLRLSRLGRAALTIKKLDMDGLISDVTSAFEFQVKEAGVKLEISQLPPCKGDATQINQVFSNLLSNAMKYLAPARPGIIKISGYKENEQSVYCVEDNGIGIAQQHQEKIFEIFHQLEPDTSAGEGLGLTIVSRILDRHSGKIWLESEPGKGSKFFISLPTEN